MNIYNSKNLKYKFDKDELGLIDDTWQFLTFFNKKFIFISDMRRYIINKIRKRYTPDEFFKFETIANKLFWNLRWILYPLWKDPSITKDKYENLVYDYNNKDQDKLPYYLTLCNSMKYQDKNDL